MIVIHPCRLAQRDLYAFCIRSVNTEQFKGTQDFKPLDHVTHQIAFLEFHEFGRTFVSVNRIVVGHDTLAIDRSLYVQPSALELTGWCSKGSTAMPNSLQQCILMLQRRISG